MVWWNALLPVMTLLLGAWLTEVAASRREANSWLRSRKDRLDQRRAVLQDRRDDFELDVLVRCHTALSDVARSASRVHHLDVMQSRNSGRYASHLLPEDASNALMLASRSLRDVVGLILDDELRERVVAAHSRMLIPSGQINSRAEEAEALFQAAAEELLAAQDAVSSRIRSIYIERELGLATAL